MGLSMVILETERLSFRDHRVEDLDAFSALEADPEFRRFVGGQPRTREAAERKFREVHLPPSAGRLKLWATDLKASGRYVGYCGIYPHFGAAGPIPGEGSLAYYLARDCWGRGLATEAARAFVAFGFGALGLDRIVSTVQSGHAASVRVLEKLGFEKTREHAAGTRVLLDFQLLKLTGASDRA